MPFDCGIIDLSMLQNVDNESLQVCVYWCRINEIFDLLVRCMPHSYAQKVLQTL